LRGPPGRSKSMAEGGAFGKFGVPPGFREGLEPCGGAATARAGISA
jgi:hypothetical protein